MAVATQRVMSLTAADLMTRKVIRLPREMSLRDAAQLLVRNQVGGAPVVDASGRCVGVFSAFDILRVAQNPSGIAAMESQAVPVTCNFQEKHRDSQGKETTTCILPPGVCPIQQKQTDSDGQPMLVCTQPHCVLTDWQIVKMETLPTDEVGRYMTTDPVTVLPGATIKTIAHMMVDAHIHRIIVVDDHERPIGLVSTTDVLAAVARADDEPQVVP